MPIFASGESRLISLIEFAEERWRCFISILFISGAVLKRPPVYLCVSLHVQRAVRYCQALGLPQYFERKKRANRNRRFELRGTWLIAAFYAEIGIQAV